MKDPHGENRNQLRRRPRLTWLGAAGFTMDFSAASIEYIGLLKGQKLLLHYTIPFSPEGFACR